METETETKRKRNRNENGNETETATERIKEKKICATATHCTNLLRTSHLNPSPNSMDVG